MAGQIVLFGAGGHGKVVLEALLAGDDSIDVVLLDDLENTFSRSLLGVQIVGGRGWFCDNATEARVMPAIGENAAREELIRWLRKQRRKLASVIHPRATVSPSAMIGDGSFVAAGAVVNADAKIGLGVIVNTGASVDHDCCVGDFAHIAPGSRLCGKVQIGARTLVGAGTVIIPGITIGSDAVIGAGSVVIRDLVDGARVAGNPARSLRDRILQNALVGRN